MTFFRPPPFFAGLGAMTPFSILEVCVLSSSSRLPRMSEAPHFIWRSS